ncbi:Hsp70 family protein [Telmatospirillum siberiense]|uniref:Hsp70 family protein n=1 Tax=Telmatospirillum siberiense TaxID=382514 RepID=A0A2N3PPS3_9PROT|nr:Hsp70 family protein [Telmatospirillum siberiense]PKU22387.1 Hsp70 family protein [Telmatospirillum siberiense]
MGSLYVGVDFGTTNSAIALAGTDGEAVVAPFATVDGPSSTQRSVLAFDGARRDPAGRVEPLIGHRAIEAYLNGDERCRLLQSFKSYLTSRAFTGTSLLGASYSLEDLIALVVADLRVHASQVAGVPVRRVVAGRPVRFVAEDGASEDDFATTRLRDAFGRAGIEEVVFEFEPIAAACHYERGLERDETVLVADFGGGTSDFCLIRLGPGRSRLARPEDAILGTEGVGVAGDAFDRRIVQHALGEHFGKGASFESAGKTLVVPAWIYGKLERWHHIGFLNTPSTLRLLRELEGKVDRPDQLGQLRGLVEHNLGFHLYRAVEKLKRDLSGAGAADLLFDHDPVRIERRVTRGEFESWIAPELAAVETCVDALLSGSGIRTEAVDRVFLTGGSSLVPAVRDIFARRFGRGKLSAGGEFVSVASGLAHRAREIFSS